MSELPPDLRKLPSGALDVLRFFGTQAVGASVDEIVAGTNLSSRGCRKAIRRLVTRYYLEMPEREYYTLSARGQEAVQILREFDGAATETGTAGGVVETVTGVSTLDTTSTVPADVQHAMQPPPPPRHARRLSIFLPQALAVNLSAKFQVGFSAPLDGSAPLRQPAQLVLRLSVPACDVQPAEYTLEITGEQGTVGPFSFRVQPQQTEAARAKLEVYQWVTAQNLQSVGGMFFDLAVTEFPTPASAALHTLAVVVRLYEGEETAAR